MDLRRNVLLKNVNQSVSINSSFGSNYDAYETACEDSDSSSFYSFTEMDDTLVQSENQLEKSSSKFNLDLMTSSTPKMKTILGAELSSIIIVEEPEPENQTKIEIPEIVIIDSSETEDSMEKTKIEKTENSLLLFEKIEQQIAEKSTPAKSNETEPITLAIENGSENVQKSPIAQIEEISPDSQKIQTENNENEFIKKYRETIEKFPGITEEEIKELTDDIPIVDFAVDSSSSVNPFVTNRKAAKKIVFNENVQKIGEKKTDYNTRRSMMPPVPSTSRMPPPVQKRETRRTIVPAALKASDRRQTIVQPAPAPMPKRKVETDNVASKKTRQSMMPPPPTTRVLHKKQSFICQYCDRSFERELALKNHQTSHCTKIPDKDKRKLLINAYKDIEPRVAAIGMPQPVAPKPRKSVLIVPPTSIVTRNQARLSLANDESKFAGITRTPSKTLTCSVCSMKFTTVLDFANHVLFHRDERTGTEQKQ